MVSQPVLGSGAGAGPGLGDVRANYGGRAGSGQRQYMLFGSKLSATVIWPNELTDLRGFIEKNPSIQVIVRRENSPRAFMVVVVVIGPVLIVGLFMATDTAMGAAKVLVPIWMRFWSLF